MTGPHVALGDRHVAGHARLRRQQVVAALVETFLVDLVADRQQPATLVEEEAEVHAEDLVAHPALDAGETFVARDHRVRWRLCVALLAVQCGQRGRRPHVALAGVVTRPCRDGSLHDRPSPRDVCRVEARRLRRREVVEQPIEVGEQSGIVRVLLGATGAEQRQPVVNPGRRGAVGVGCVDPLAARVGGDDEVARQVAVVDRRDVPRCERLQRRGVVPVEQVPVEMIEGIDGVHRALHALERLVRADPTEVPGGDGREEVEADVRRRRAMGHDGCGVLLEVVRRQVVIEGRDVFLEVAPRPASDESQRGDVVAGCGQFGRVVRHADPRGHDRRGEPDRGHERRDSEVPVPGDDARAHDQHGWDEPTPHQPDVVVDRSLRAGGSLGGGRPLEAAPARPAHAEPGAPRCISHQPGVVTEEREVQQATHDTAGEVLDEAIDLAAHRDPGPPAHEPAEDREEGRPEEGGHERHRPRHGGSRWQQRQADDERGDQRDRRGAAAEVVEHLPSTEPADATPSPDDPRQELPVAASPAMSA